MRLSTLETIAFIRIFQIYLPKIIYFIRIQIRSKRGYFLKDLINPVEFENSSLGTLESAHMNNIFNFEEIY